jgi:hypothetical protein
MTRVYRSPEKIRGLRVLIVGAGAYPYAKTATQDVPALPDLTSVAPGVMVFLQRLLTDWREGLAMGLLTVDLLLSDPKQPGGSHWPAFGVPGEAAAGQPLEPAYRQHLEQALFDALDGASGEDGLLVLFCGHGFSRAARYFVLSDFAPKPPRSVEPGRRS